MVSTISKKPQQKTSAKKCKQKTSAINLSLKTFSEKSQQKTVVTATKLSFHYFLISFISIIRKPKIVSRLIEINLIRKFDQNLNPTVLFVRYWTRPGFSWTKWEILDRKHLLWTYCKWREIKSSIKLKFILMLHQNKHCSSTCISTHW